VIAAAVIAALAAACDGPPTSCEPYCANPIDRVVVPRLRDLGLQPREVDPFEHCRRIAIDLLGRGPSGAEIEACMVATPTHRVELAQAHPDYVTAARRAWSETLGYDVLETWSRDLADLDATIAAHADGALTYGELATAVVTHPAFIAMHPEDGWAEALYRVFLGRPAREDEVAALRPLSAPWQSRFLCEGAIWWNLYQGYLDDGETVANARDVADLDCADLAKSNVGFNPCLCTPDDGLLGCATPALGLPVVIAASCVEPDDIYADANVMLTGAHEPGGDDTCPDGTQHPRCRDREVGEDFITMYPPQTWRRIDAAGRAALAGIGMALAARTDFWEAAADRELRRLTGWWQTSFRHPDSDLPEVRAVVAELLRTGSTVREIQIMIATSQLYAAPASTPPAWGDRAGEPPAWAMGPTKLLAAEPWLDTMMRAVGERPGVCDVRNLTAYGYEDELADPRYIADPSSSLDGVIDDFYLDAVESLGGCKSKTPRPAQSNVGLAFAQGEHARIACAYGDEATPGGWTADFPAAVNHLIRRLYARPPADGELDELVGEMQACVAAGACVDADAAARWMCQRLADSTEFATY
jgi:hypothetical protein